MNRLCPQCLNNDQDWFEKHGEAVKIPFCAANKPNFPVATKCEQFEPIEVEDD